MRYRELGIRWGEAMALNVYGLAELEDDNPHRARKRCQDAMAIFTDLNDQRGIGLTSIALGRALRKMGSQETYLFSKEADEFLEEAKNRLHHAQAIFPEVVDEPMREVEIQAELGRLYREWAYVYRQQGNVSVSQIQDLERKAKDYLLKAAEKARELDLLAEETDAYADLAALYFNGQAYDQALDWVDKAEGRFSKEWVLTPEWREPLPESPLPQYFLILGKCSLMRGDIAWEQEQQEEAVEWWTKAFGYFELYSPTATTLSLTARKVYRKLVALQLDQLEELKKHCHRTEEIYGLEPTTLHREFPELIRAVSLLRGEGENGSEQ